MNTFQLSCFLAVSETLNFARAAEQLNITQPAMTHQIHTLEAELNTKLFRRSTRSVEITPSGILFLADAKEILAISIKAKQRFESAGGQMFLEFTVGSQSYPQIAMLPSILKQLVISFPSLHPHLQIMPSPYLNHLIEEEKLDVIVEFEEVKNHRSSSVYQELAKIPIHCVCLADNPLSCRPSVRTEDLKQQKQIIMPPFKCPSPITELQRPLLSGKSPSDIYICDSMETALLYAQAGLGFTLYPDIFLPPDSGLYSIPIADAQPLSFGLSYKTVKGNDVLKKFMKLMQEYFKNSMK